MIPRTQNYDWGSHSVNARKLQIETNVNPTTGEIVFKGKFRTTRTVLDTDGGIISREEGPSVWFENPDFTQELTLPDGTVLTIGQIIMGITEFYKKEYDARYEDSQIVVEE